MAPINSLVSSNPSLPVPFVSTTHKRVSFPHQTISFSSPPRLHLAMVAQAMDPQSVDGAVPTKGDAEEANSAVDSDRSTGAAEGDSEWVLLRTNSDLGSLQSSDNGSPPFPSWAKKAIDSVVCLYKRIRGLEDEAEKAVDTVIEIVEKAAETTEKVTSIIADALPGDGDLKEAVLKIEDIADKLDKDAEKAEAFMNKVDEIKEEEDTLLKPIIDAVEAIEKEIDEQEGRNPKAAQK